MKTKKPTDREKRLMRERLDGLISSGVSSPYAERALDLKSGTFALWRGGKFSKTEFALMGIVSKMPWMIDVAAEQFDRDYADYRLELAAAGIRYRDKMAQRKAAMKKSGRRGR